MTKPTLVAIYARVSTGEQNPEAQLLALREYAARRGFTQDPPRYRLSPARPAASPARQEGQTRQIMLTELRQIILKVTMVQRNSAYDFTCDTGPAKH